MTIDSSWIEPGYEGPWGPQTLPYGVFSRAGRRPSVFTRVGATALDLDAAFRVLAPEHAPLFGQESLNTFMASGRGTWEAVRARLTEWVTDPAFAKVLRPHLYPLSSLRATLPIQVADWVDFYGSIDHARIMASIFRPGQPSLPPAWPHMPMGYHGRAGTVIVSGEDIPRPDGQRLAVGEERPRYGPSRKLDIEAEIGFVVGAGSERNEPIPPERLADHIFGVVLVNDWSARDIQSFESVPLGPFLGKSFATSISEWVTPLAAFTHAWCEPPVRLEPLQAYLGDAATERGLDIAVEVRVNDSIIARPPYSTMYWTPGQMLAHVTGNGASARTGDLLGSGTISGPVRHQRGSLMELTENGVVPVHLDDGSTRTFLEDGDEIVFRADAPGPRGTRIGIGDVVGRVVPSTSMPEELSATASVARA
ncbi:fumarylacetoacetate hydrolase family protein [Microbacterium sp. MYb62]|uniref:fumarylacetoacetate hydrolase family protein n=1 Tax=Microbacterium sp. MYb62 TaxID=1848690 RepID=UPI000CFAB218|nr:fumarylacetoacetate hydrolase family protein [Microbacterium sp. MYb62]PRB09813.1 fumarylacetoacetase [Microbacterium sp. MYb62]